MYSQFIHTSNVQTWGVCTEHPSSAQVWIVHHLLFVFWSVETTQKDVVHSCITLELNRMPILSSSVHHICRYALYVVMTLRLSDHCSHLNSAERRDRDMDKIKLIKETRSWTKIFMCMHFRSQPTARVIPVVPTFGSPELPQRRQRWTGIWKEEGMPRDSAHTARMTHTFTCQWPACSVQWYSVSMSAFMVCLLATYEIWMNICCTHHRLRAYDWWLHTCTLNVVHIKPSAGCLTCEHSFPPPVCRSCLQPSSFTFDVFWWRWQLFVFLTFLIKEIYLRRYGRNHNCSLIYSRLNFIYGWIEAFFAQLWVL